MSSDSPTTRPTTGMSTSSNNESVGGTKKRGGKKKNVPPISLEEIFNQLSTVTSSNLNPPPGRIVLTPRSAEVCLKLGVNPEILKIRDIDSFWEHGMDPAVQRIRHEAYVQRRHDIMKECRLEKKRLNIAEFEAATNMNQVETMTPEMILEQQREQSSTLIQLEMQRIEKMQKRQQKELEQMISYEVARAQTQQELDKRILENKKKEDMRKRQQAKRMKLMTEERRLRELQKLAMEEAEEANRVAVAKQMHEREKAFQEEKLSKEKEDKRKAREDDAEKKRKNEEHRAQVEKFFADEQAELRKRLDSIHLADEKKQAAIVERQQRLAEELRKKRDAIEQRIEKNMEMAKMIEQKKKDDFLERQDHHEKILSEKMQKQEEERRLRAQEIELQEQRRQIILMQQRKEEEKKAEALLVKFDEEEAHVEEIKEVRMRDHEIHRERKNLRTQMKLENVKRVQRVGEYKRMGTLKKIEDTDHRTRSMLEQKKALIEERKRAAAATKIQKEAIAKVMEEVRTNASKANKIISQALSGKVTLESLTAPGGGKGGKGSSKKRPKSASRSGKSLNGDDRIESSTMGLGRQSHSAGAFDKDDLDDGEMEASNKMYSLPNHNPPTPYISPYDEDLVAKE